jgi:peptide/nickel transport system ATP-binding protein
VVRSLADRVAVLYLGRLCEVGDVEAVFSGPSHPYTRMLLDAVPIAQPERQQARLKAAAEQVDRSDETPTKGCRFRPRCAVGHAHEHCGSVDPELVETAAPALLAACHYPGETS